MSRRVHLVVSIPADEALARLAGGIDQSLLSRISVIWSKGEAPLGRVRGARFQFWARRYGRNSFAPLCRGRVGPAPEGALIEATIGVHWFVRWFIVVWFPLAAVPGAFAIAQTLGFGSGWNVPVTVIASATLLVGGGLVAIAGTVMASGEEAELAAALQRWFADVAVAVGGDAGEEDEE